MQDAGEVCSDFDITLDENRKPKTNINSAETIYPAAFDYTEPDRIVPDLPNMGPRLLAWLYAPGYRSQDPVMPLHLITAKYDKFADIYNTCRRKRKRTVTVRSRHVIDSDSDTDARKRLQKTHNNN